jgi:uncharacterized RDD family membrane protein YckC
LLDRALNEWEDGMRTKGAMFIFGALIFAIMALVLFNALAFFVMEWVGSGKTIGKKMMRLRVVRTNGFALDFGAVALRNLMRVLDFALLIPPIMFPTLAAPLFTKHRQRLGDLLAGTIVVHDGADLSEQRKLRQLLTARATAAAPAPSEISLPNDRNALSPAQIIAAEKTLVRWDTSTAAAKADLRREVVEKIAAQLGRTIRRGAATPETPQTNGAAAADSAPDDAAVKQFLADLLTEIYQRRERKLG